MKVNIREFEDKYIKDALIPEDVMRQLTDAALRGDSEAEVRDTILDEIRIRAFYNEHPELRPKSDWEVRELSFFMIDLMKSIILKEDLLDEKAQELIRRIGIITDKYKVNNQPTDRLEYLHETALWLKSEVI